MLNTSLISKTIARIDEYESRIREAKHILSILGYKMEESVREELTQIILNYELIITEYEEEIKRSVGREL